MGDRSEDIQAFDRQAVTTLKTKMATKRRSSRWFYTCMGVVATLVVIAGFGGSYYRMAADTGSLSLLVKAHGLVSAAWLVLFITQSTLVATRRTAVHRRLGVTGALLAVAIVVLGYATAMAAARRGHDLNFGDTQDPLNFLVFSLGDIVGFSILVGAGLWYRRRPEVHKRLMLLATVSPMMNAPIVHFFFNHPEIPARPILFLVPMAAILFAPAVYDRISRGRFHPVSLWGAVLLFAWGNLRAAVIGPSKVWHDIAAWLIQ
jgi:hypothetical protein